MKENLMVLIFLLIFSMGGLGQNSFPEAQFNVSKMNVLYTDIPNPIKVFNLQEGDSLLGQTVKIIKGAESGSYKVVPMKSKKELFLYVVNAKGDTISQLKFKSIKLPPVDVSVLGFKQGLVSQTSLKSIQKLDTKINVPFEAKVEIVSFTLTLISGETRKISDVKVRGARLNAMAKKLLANVKQGDRVCFEKIKVSAPGGTQKVPPIILKVK